MHEFVHKSDDPYFFTDISLWETFICKLKGDAFPTNSRAER